MSERAIASSASRGYAPGRPLGGSTTPRALAGLLTLTAVTAVAWQPPADLAIVNARIYTGAPAAPWAEVLVIRGDRIAAAGSNAEHGAAARAASRVIDARGARGYCILVIADLILGD